MKLLYPPKMFSFICIEFVCIEKKMSAPIAEDVAHYKELFIGVINDLNHNVGVDLKYTEDEYKLLQDTKKIMADIKTHNEKLKLNEPSMITMSSVSL